jgi:hypothetical protein
MIGCVMANYLFRSELEKVHPRRQAIMSGLHNVCLPHGLKQGEKK